jgi:hypothetical protein
MVLRAKGERTWREFSGAWGIDIGYLHRVAMGLRPPNDEILSKLGIEKVTIYRIKKSNDKC